mgnify:CR=1 FL=1
MNGGTLYRSNASTWVQVAAGVSTSGATNLSWTAATSTVVSDTGSDAILTVVDGSNPGLMTVADKSKLDVVEDNADVTDAINVDAAGAVMESDFDAQTILRATTDDTPTPLTVGEQTLVGRITAGNIDALTPAQIRTLINVEDGATADLTTEEIQDVVGPFVASGGTKTGITVTYQDLTDDMDFEVDVASDTQQGIVELAITSEVDTGTDTTRAITPDALANSALQGKVDGIEALADVTDATNVDAAGAVMESDFDANTILAADTDNTPAPLTVPVQTLVGRITAGNIDALTPTEARTLLNVEDGSTGDQTAADIRGLGFFDTTNDGTTSGLDSDLLDGQEGTYYLNRTNHTGTQAHTTISDFDAGVQTNRLDQMASPTADVDLGNQKITSLAEPTVADDAATKAYVDAQSSGLDLKDSVRVATTGSITLSGTHTNDGVGVNADDRVLDKNCL